MLTVQRVVWGALAAVFVIVGAAALWTSLPPRAGEPLPVLGTVPPFTLMERSGRVVRRDELEGSVWVADFIFTRCEGICPALTTGLAGLQRRLAVGAEDGVRLVSFSVDPGADTPEVLREYAKRYRASENGWWFLTGDRDVLYALIGEGFRLNVARREVAGEDDPNQLITHTDRVVLVDAALRIRGYYHGTEPEELERLVRDIERLDDVGTADERG